MTTESIDIKPILTPYLNEIFARKAEKLTAIDVRKFTSYTDAIIVVTASSSRQVSSIAENIHTNMKKAGNMPLGVEGMQEGTWALLDFGDVIIHIFNKETRDFYNIEGLWADAPRVDTSEFNREPSLI
ncbi:MAG: ribosome silencing factor [Desulfamplus sp.]|nr:ribosome silencing factor [Desulfamplus sp.]MBF0413885.1 ribosome silencing factor [Desulfamplus sp.]